MKGTITKCSLIIEAFDFGPAITEIVFSFPMQITDLDLERGTFTIIIKKRNTPYLIEIESATTTKNELSLKLMCHPEKFHLSPFVYDHITHHDRFAEKIDLLVHTNRSFSLGDFDYQDTVDIQETVLVTPDLDGFSYGKFAFDNRIHLAYGLFKPTGQSGNIPLVVWLHGAKEGGDDPRVPILGNPVTNLKKEGVQNRFGGFYLLVPQARTMWMDDGSGLYTNSGRSVYTQALTILIKEILEQHPDIDRKRVYLGGCSNGGFMTIRLLSIHPELFAAAFPASEACLDEWLSDDDISRIKSVPIWFFACRSDAVVSSSQCSIMTYQRLITAGATDSKLTLVDEVRDRRHAFFESDGSAYLYDGHWAWLEALNNATADDGVAFFNWLFSQAKQ